MNVNVIAWHHHRSLPIVAEVSFVGHCPHRQLPPEPPVHLRWRYRLRLMYLLKFTAATLTSCSALAAVRLPMMRANSPINACVSLSTRFTAAAPETKSAAPEKLSDDKVEYVFRLRKLGQLIHERSQSRRRHPDDFRKAQGSVSHPKALMTARLPMVAVVNLVIG